MNLGKVDYIEKYNEVILTPLVFDDTCTNHPLVTKIYECGTTVFEINDILKLFTVCGKPIHRIINNIFNLYIKNDRISTDLQLLHDIEIVLKPSDFMDSKCDMILPIITPGNPTLTMLKITTRLCNENEIIFVKTLFKRLRRRTNKTNLNRK